ncbi:MAG: GDP-mannose 4,6-dehydratase [Deltaproteobacteria bacterium]|jgi:UDP-glucose 4-epimerase|nr:GDP-mannose 4,6-dehydratase [Deltaproteobacteria bacterium]
MKDGRGHELTLEGYNRVLVTGGSGFIGGHLVETLGQLPDKEIFIFDIKEPWPELLTRPNIHWIKGDLAQEEQVNAAIKGQNLDLVYHVGANANGSRSVLEPRKDFNANVIGTENVYLAVIEENQTGGHIKRLVCTSSASVYGRPKEFPMTETHPTEPFIPYGAGKRAMEVIGSAYIKTFGEKIFPIVFIRLYCIYGPREDYRNVLVEPGRFIRWALNDKPIPIVGDPDRKTRDFGFVGDIVQGFLIVTERGLFDEYYNVGSGTETSMRKLIQTIADCSGKTITMRVNRAITEDTYRLATGGEGVAPEASGIAKLMALGYQPRISLREGVQITIDSFGGKKPELPEASTIFNPNQKGEKEAAEEIIITHHSKEIKK